MDSGEDDGAASSETMHLFQEPSGYYQPEKPATFVNYTLKSGQELSLRLVGHNPLWGHLLWNAAQVVSTYLEENAEAFVRGKTVLELGAGAGLPGLTCAIEGARKVLVTDYPDNDLIENLRYNIDHCEVLPAKDIIGSQGFLWGNSTDELKAFVGPDESGFDLLILADILFNHSEHTKLVQTIRDSLKREASSVALVFFTPYRPWLLDKDLRFFDLAREDGFIVNKILEHTMEKVMFEEDPGDELLRRTVFGYEVKWAS